jgi:hypothetical protein
MGQYVTVIKMLRDRMQAIVAGHSWQLVADVTDD